MNRLFRQVVPGAMVCAGVMLCAFAGDQSGIIASTVESTNLKGACAAAGNTPICNGTCGTNANAGRPRS
jgi:hypothetical protein